MFLVRFRIFTKDKNVVEINYVEDIYIANYWPINIVLKSGRRIRKPKGYN